MKEALINIDYTNDFVADDGSLTCGQPGQAIEDKICDLTERFIQDQEFVVFAIDSHQKDDPYHPESRLFPSHNIQGSQGQELYGRLAGIYQGAKDQAHVYYMEKTRYSAFAGTNLDMKLRERHIQTLHLVGVCTDICILHTAVDAYNLGYQLVIHPTAVASFNQAGHDWALTHFETCLDAKIVD
ncbi:isochorismatase family cysteine hydrolase [Aerococcus sp. UMB7834]|uniref:cysteine hydrolase family protein n=1 Tax=Aerococcus sp. UMB7834 TaxID=3046342 RepID=UPI002550A326|nr:isochorismatase family cysteine hydrolase [Aerococcus sp. UMB7834]MDK6804212.1 isochorismatase family cysteine hydrolase [Aerococcus sp. UMB7834]